MNVLFLSTWFPTPPDNGARIRVCHLLRALSARHRVTVLAFNPRGTAAAARLCSHAADAAVTLEGVPVDPFRYTDAAWWLKFASPTPLACWPSREMWRRVAQAARARRWDVVVASQLPVVPYLRLVGKVPAILDLDAIWTLETHARFQAAPSAWQRLRHRLSWHKSRLYEQYWLTRLAACTVVSPQEQAYLRRLAPRRAANIHLCPNGVDCAHNRPDLAPRQPHALVYAGALTYRANYDAMQSFLRDTYPLIQAQEPAVSLTITGDTAGVDLGGLRLDESVHLSGYVADVRRPVAAAAVAVVPLRQGGGTRLKVLEAMALGTPVVATSKGVEGLSLTADEHFLLADTPAAFAGAVARLLRDPVRARRLACAARTWVAARYDWTETGARFVRVVETAAAGQPA